MDLGMGFWGRFCVEHNGIQHTAIGIEYAPDMRESERSISAIQCQLGIDQYLKSLFKSRIAGLDRFSSLARSASISSISTIASPTPSPSPYSPNRNPFSFSPTSPTPSSSSDRWERSMSLSMVSEEDAAFYERVWLIKEEYYERMQRASTPKFDTAEIAKAVRWLVDSFETVYQEGLKARQSMLEVLERESMVASPAPLEPFQE